MTGKHLIIGMMDIEPNNTCPNLMQNKIFNLYYKIVVGSNI